jgi:hypothetical protein
MVGRKLAFVRHSDRASRGFGNPFHGLIAEKPPAPRKRDVEALLCEAIRKRLLVSLYYGNDRLPRYFGPSAVYHSTKGKVCVCGLQGGDGFHVFEVGKIRSASITTAAYEPAPIDHSDSRYGNGIVCEA